ncbi:hypothetical protein ASPWEDRAFT_22619 [Aspergillus wentii DTO 134E9]|uniref:Ubiquitin carboxyl-terminal hydrolase n=1 Tax=Aspergillus wentii DTO 134E9 TaxID=1073089 RepID=A0A1L9RZV6_ASPWE|nr:uncharacterized protein ASPWEDRAFT_22619 [Aspergillus wentii DTO 134E9]KAI9932858.1 hypothetical protein MW887_009110 [Aspergillus wentii]OJJ40443.1 hypothetical protein ASPWEDRAFT_22619 [Aspergillus wentii DTO 134E9]
MGSFLRSFRSNNANPPPVGATPARKEPQPPPMTPLEKKLLDMGPIRPDGSDKFFGMENYGNTCYCNSILQCLYYSVPFREAVINYPTRTPIESLKAALAKTVHYPDPVAQQEAEAQAERQKALNAARPGLPPNPQQKPEDKDSPEYKKKMALQTLPLLETKNNATSYGMSESLFTSLKDIFESVVGSDLRMGIVRPQQFLDVLRREHEMFRTAMHQDAHEFLNLLLNEVVANVEAEASKQPQMEKSLPPTESAESFELTPSSGSKTPNTTRWVHELFEGTLTSETQCLTCEKVSQRDEIFLDLSVDLEQHSSVTSCLRKFSAEEMLCERNKFHCDNCGGLQEAEKRMKIKRLPRILALHLKRFKYTEDLQRLQKLFHRVVYPYHLRLFNTTDDAEDPDRLYELYAVVVHIGGGPYHGHYVAIIKTEDRGWLLFDDEMVEPVDKNYVRNFFGDKPGLACAYVLFYQETTLEAVMKEQEQENMASATGTADAADTASKPNGVSQLNLSQTYSGSQVPSHDEPNRFTPIRSPTAPPLTTHHEEAEPDRPLSQPYATARPPTRPSIPPIPETPGTPLSPKKSDVQTRKEQAKEEKERRHAEKEKHKNDKQRRKEEEIKSREDKRREEAELRAALEASRASKVDEDRRHAPEPGKESDSPKKPGGLNRLRRGSKSISHRLNNHKDHRGSSSDIPGPSVPEKAAPIHAPAPAPPASARTFEHPARSATAPRPMYSNKHNVREEERADTFKDPKHERSGHGKWRSFSLRKKSFSILS